MKYQEYYSLSGSELKNLIRTNFYRQKNNLPIIDVPKTDKSYWKKFNKQK